MHIGLTGGIASGKSTVAERFSALGVPVIDTDLLSRELVAPGQPALACIVEHFGPTVLTASGELDRSRLRARVFAQPEERRWLEDLLHPLIRERAYTLARDALAQGRSLYTLTIIPLLFEHGAYPWLDRILVVDAPDSLRRNRALARPGMTPALLDGIFAAQLAREARLERADDVLHNHGSLTDLFEQVDALHRRYQEQARSQPAKDAPASDASPPYPASLQ
ncbi:MAG: dephospho-CoA kinase [Halothiobacillaceae bacterium]|nr:dephospho-CoA kinase [Halothiobacillaceae bacterium]